MCTLVLPGTIGTVPIVPGNTNIVLAHTKEFSMSALPST